MMAKRRNIRFAITIKGNCLEQWKLDCLKLLMKMPEVKLAMIMEFPDKPAIKRVSPLLKMFQAIICSRSKILKKIPLPSEFEKIPRVQCLNKNDSKSSYSKTDKEFIKGMDLDFILHLEGTEMDRDILSLARYGVWAFRFGQAGNFSQLPGWWEIMNNEEVTWAGLYRLTNNLSDIIIWKDGYFATVPDSYQKNYEMLCQSVLSWPALVCKEIMHHAGNPDNRVSKISASPHEDSINVTTMQTAKMITLLWKHKTRKLFRKLFCYEYWNVGIVQKPIHSFLNDKQPNIDWLIPRRNCYYADPFGMKDKDGIHILMEEVDHKVVKGYISGFSMCVGDNDANTQDWKRSVIKQNSHMSYPYLLEHGGEVYCIPETSEAREVAVYSRKNGKWEKLQTLLQDFAAVDSTIIHHGDYWWLFCTKADSGPQSDNSELHLFYAKDLFGDWNPHRSNPVKVDVRSSRPAGTPFVYDNQLIRPAQDCSKTYGGRIVLNKVTVLSLDEFEEIPLSPVEPRKDSMYPDGVHTISEVGGITVFDGKRFDYSVFHFFRKLYKFKPMKKVS